MRSRILLATLAAVLLLTAPAAAQSPDPASLEAAYEFDGSIAPSFAEGSTAPRSAGPATFATATVDGVSRQVGAFAAEQPYRFEVGSLWQSQYAVSVLFRLDAVAGRRRVLNVQGPGDANALYVEDGRLVYELGATDATGAAGRVAEGAWVHVVLVRRPSGETRVFADGQLDIAFTDTANAAIFLSHGDPGFPGLNYRLRLFDGAGAEGVSGQIARLRLFEDAMDDATAAGLRRLDTAAPVPAFPSEPVVGGAFRVGSGTTLHGQITDEGSAARVESWVEDAGGAEVAGTRAERPLARTGGQGPEPERVVTYNTFGPYPGLSDGGAYELVVVTEDASGNVSAPQRYPLRADHTPPAALTVDGPAAKTSDRSPLVTGGATVGPHDSTTVYGDLCAGTSCAVTRGGGSSQIGWFEADVAGGRWSAEVRMDNPDPDGDPDQQVDLPNGTYTVQLWLCDDVSNCLTRERTFEVVDRVEPKPRPVVEQPGDGDAPPAPPAPGPAPSAPAPPAPSVPRTSVVPPPAAPSDRAVAAALSRAAAQALGRGGLRRLARGLALTLRPERPGKVSVAVYDAAKRRVLARRSGGRIKPTAKGRAKLRRAKRLTVVVRTTFTPAGGRPVTVDRRLTLKR